MKKEKHIQVKDNGIKLSNKVGDQLSDIKNTLENKIASDLTKGTELSLLQYQIKQNNQIRAFKEESKQLIRQTRKNLAKELKTDKSVNLTKEQVQSITKEIDKGLLFLRNNAQMTYQDIVTKTMVELRSKPALELSDALSKHLEKGLNIGVVYKDGKHFKFDSYYEMKARTDIQQDIGKNMVQEGHENGVIFYIASFYGDCAKDHVEYQGKIYVDEGWEANAPEDRKEEIREYINQNKTMTVQAVMAGPAYLSTRPNCRHYFQYIDIDSVLGAKTKEDVNKLRNELNLNFNGKYQPEKYEALQKQRLNERKIRAEKQEIERQEMLLHLNSGDKAIQSRILMGENNVRRIQAEQRQLIKDFSNLERNYDREQLGNRVNFGDERRTKPDKLTNQTNSGSMIYRKALPEELPPPIPNEDYSKIKKELKQQGIKIRSNKEIDRYLDTINAEASISDDGKTIYVRTGRNPSASAIHEEIRHAWQIDNKGKIVSSGDSKELYKREIKAKEYLLANAKKLKLTEMDIEQTKEGIKHYKELMKDDNNR